MIFADRSKAVLLLWILLVSYVSCLSSLCFMFVSVMLSCLFFAVVRSPVGERVASWRSCVVFFCVLSLSYIS